MMIHFQLIVLGSLCFCLRNVASVWSEFEFRSVDNLNGTASMPIDFDVQTKRIRKGVYGITGTIRITDAPDAYVAEVVIYHSALRNNIYKLVPFKVPEGPLCDKINQEYRKYLMNELHAVSDMPFSEDDAENLCAHFVKDKSFSVKNYEFENSNVPKFLQAGMYKAYILLKKGGVIMSGLEAVVDLS